MVVIITVDNTYLTDVFNQYKTRENLLLDLSQYLGHDLWEFFRDSSGWVSHRFDQPSNQNRLTADRSDEVEALWKSRKKNVGGS